MAATFSTNWAELLADESTRDHYETGAATGVVPSRPVAEYLAEEQADDAAALLDALATGPAAVFGVRAVGGTFSLCLLVRHPEIVRGAILHEPGLYALVDDFDTVDTRKDPCRGREAERRAVRCGRTFLVLHRRGRRWLEPSGTGAS